MFKEDGNVIHFAAPKGSVPNCQFFQYPSFHIPTPPPPPKSKNHTLNFFPSNPFPSQPASTKTKLTHFKNTTVHAAVPSNTFAVYGNGEDKELTELVPGILNQLGPDSLASLRKLAESYQSLQKKEGGGGGGGGGGDENKDDDDDIPDLVAGENFESKVE